MEETFKSTLSNYFINSNLNENFNDFNSNDLKNQMYLENQGYLNDIPQSQGSNQQIQISSYISLKSKYMSQNNKQMSQIRSIVSQNSNEPLEISECKLYRQQSIRDIENFQNNKILKPYFNEFKNHALAALNQKDYYISKYLTSGGQGVIFEGYRSLKEDSKQEYIFKIYFGQNEHKIEEEINIMRIFEKNINVISMIESIKVNHNILILVLEKCNYSLQDELIMIEKNKQQFSQTKLFQMIFDLLDGLIQFRIYNILHLDIKPHNILAASNGTYLYTDFGLSKFNVANLDNKESIEKKQNINLGYTERYAPEEQKQNDSYNVTFGTDVYSLGKTFLDIIDIYKMANSNEKCIQPILDIIKQNMTQKSQERRKSCLKLHKLFIDLVIKNPNMIFLENYTDKIKVILQLFPYCVKKDIIYFKELKSHYQKTLLKIQKDVIYKYINNHSEIANSLYNLGICKVDRGQLKIALQKYLLKSLRMREWLGNEHRADVANSLNTIGKCLKNFGFYKAALKFSQKSLYLRTLLFNGAHPSIAESLDNVGQCYIELQQFIEAEKSLKESLNMRKMLYQENSEEFSETLLNIGKCLNEMGEYAESLEYSMKSLTMKQQLFEGNHPSIAASLCQVGLCYKDIKEYHEGLKYSQDSLEMRRKLFKGNHPDIIESLLIVELCQGELNNQKQSLSNLKVIEKMAEQVVFNTHQFIQATQNNKGIAYILEGDYQNSFKSILKSLHIDEKKQKRGYHSKIVYHLNIAKNYYLKNDYIISILYLFEVLEIIVMQNNYFQQIGEYLIFLLWMLGLCLIELNDPLNGLKFVQESQKTKKIVFKDDHPGSLMILEQVIAHLLENNHLKEAFNYSNEFNEIVIEHFKGDSIYKPYSKYITGLCYYYVGNYQVALKFYLESLCGFEYILKKDPSKFTMVLNAIGLCYRDLKDHENALEFMLRSLNMKQKFLNDTDVQMITTFSNLGLCYCDIGDSQNGLKYTLKALEMHKKQRKENNKITATIINCVGRSYFVQGDYLKALDYQLKSLEMRRQIFIKNHPKLALSLYDVGTTYKKQSDFQNALLYLLESLELRKKLYNGYYHPDIELSLFSILECFKNLGDTQNVVKFQQELDLIKQMNLLF